jgi:hypothetical protein
MHAVAAVPVATAINPATAVTACAARTAVPLGCTGIVYTVRCSLSGNRPQAGMRLSGNRPQAGVRRKRECAVSGNRTVSGNAPRLALRDSLPTAAHHHLLLLSLHDCPFRFVSICFDIASLWLLEGSRRSAAAQSPPQSRARCPGVAAPISVLGRGWLCVPREYRVSTA